jgi:hypothetical protein
MDPMRNVDEYGGKHCAAAARERRLDGGYQGVVASFHTAVGCCRETGGECGDLPDSHETPSPRPYHAEQIHAADDTMGYLSKYWVDQEGMEEVRPGQLLPRLAEQVN